MKWSLKKRSIGDRLGELPKWRMEEGASGAAPLAAMSGPAHAKRSKLLEGLARGEAAIREGRVVTNSRAKQRMARWLK